MTLSAPAPVSSTWLEQREPADATARSANLIGLLRRHLPTGRPLVVHDLGSGTGSMTRWLAPRLPGPQHWHLYDVDTTLLQVASARAGSICAADGLPVAVETRTLDITGLRAPDLRGTDLITASALLDILTAAELEALARACIAAERPALFTLTVVGQVELTPVDPLDRVVGAAFNSHQRRPARGDILLGPEAVSAATDLFSRSGADVHVRPSHWRLGAHDTALASAWFDGWVDAAREICPELAIDAYVQRRRRDMAAGRLRIVVHHADLLTLPRR
jgi:SAM-dependent methyltransferase